MTEPGQVVEQVGQVGGDLLVAREEAEVLVEPRRDRVVVPGADVRIAPQPVGLAAHNQRALGVDLQRGEAVDDMDAGRLQGARPLDVAPLVEAGLQLHQADRLLALLGSLDQRRHVRRVVARAVDARLDGNRLRVGRRGSHEPLEGARERVVRVMHEHRALAQLGKERLAVAGREARRHHRDPRILLQVGPLQREELVQLGEVEQAGNEVDLLLDHVEPVLQLLEHPRRARARDLEAHRVAEGAAAQLQLDRLEQVVRLVGDGEVRVARDPECRALDDLHHREEPGEEVPDHPLERHEQAARADRQEARQQLGHLDAREPLLAGLRVAHEESEAQRETRDVRERLPGPDRERCQHREDLAVEDPLELLQLRRLEVLDLCDHDSLSLERGPQGALPELRLLGRRARRRACGSRRARPAASARPASERRRPRQPGPSGPPREP